MSKVRKFAAVLAWAVTILAAAAIPVHAAAPSLTVAQQKAFDRTVSAAESKTGDKLKRQHEEYLSLIAQSLEWEGKIKELHGRNAENESRIRGLIRKVDEEKLTRLLAEWEKSKAKYQKLFDLYRTVNAQLDAARKLKNKTLTSVLQAQADGLKIPVQLAREDIKAKKDAYESAKKAAAAKMKKIRGTLDGIESCESRIRAAKSAISGANQSRQSVWSAFTKSLTKRDAKSASGLLDSVNSLTRQINERHRNIHSLETAIAGIIRSAEAQLA